MDLVALVQAPARAARAARARTIRWSSTRAAAVLTGRWSHAVDAAHAREQIASLMLSAFAPLSPVELPPVAFCRAHRWRFAYGTVASDSTHRFEESLGLGVAGDWCNSPNLDGAYFSGHDLAETYLNSLAKKV